MLFIYFLTRYPRRRPRILILSGCYSGETATIYIQNDRLKVNIVYDLLGFRWIKIIV
jgi:hypothetical protein